MSVYDKASLVLIPSGTKTSKVYSQKPVNGDGDFTFSRSTAATRVNASGNIEKETQNLLLQSNSFTTGWSLSNVTMTSGQAGYDGTNDAWLMTDTNSAGYGIIDRLVTTGGITTFSCYAKSGTTNIFGLRPIGGSSPYVFFDLSNGTFESAGDTANLIDWDIQDAGSGWYRCSVTTSATATQVLIYIATTGGGLAPAGSTIYIQDAQLEQGLVARDYIETTTAAVEGGITDNVPRLDYTDSSCPALLLEPQRTNVFNHSEYSAAIEYNNVNSITNNAAISPEGVQNALEINATGNDIADSYRNAGAGVVATFSVFAKAGTGDSIRMSHSATGSSAYADFNLTSGTRITTGGAQYIDSDIEDYGNGWWRCSITFTTGTGSYINRLTFQDTGTYQLYGFQLEAGSCATSYIPTYGTSVTRNGDSCHKTSVSSLIGQTEGTLFIETIGQTKDSSLLLRVSKSGGLYGNSVYLDISAGGNLRAVVYDDYVQQMLESTSISDGQQIKAALAYKENDCVLYVNGTQVASDTSVSFPTPLTDILIGSYYPANSAQQYKGINQSLLFKTRLSNEELAALTTI